MGTASMWLFIKLEVVKSEGDYIWLVRFQYTYGFDKEMLFMGHCNASRIHTNFICVQPQQSVVKNTQN